jgi:hypothetical protein
MGSEVSRDEWFDRTLRAWQLALLRFAVTLHDADWLSVLAIAREIDRLGQKTDFRFFQRTSESLCVAIRRPNESGSGLLREYLARIDDERLKRAFASATELEQPKVSSARNKAVKRDASLWRGLPARRPHPI